MFSCWHSFSLSCFNLKILTPYSAGKLTGSLKAVDPAGQPTVPGWWSKDLEEKRIYSYSVGGKSGKGPWSSSRPCSDYCHKFTFLVRIINLQRFVRGVLCVTSSMHFRALKFNYLAETSDFKCLLVNSNVFRKSKPCNCRKEHATHNIICIQNLMGSNAVNVTRKPPEQLAILLYMVQRS